MPPILPPMPRQFRNRHANRTPWALALAGCAMFILAGCGRGVAVLVVNRSGARLDLLEVLGEHDRRPLPALAPGDSAWITFPGRGEDALAVRGRRDGRALVQPAGAYVEDGYRVRAEVDANGVVRMDVVPTLD